MVVPARAAVGSAPIQARTLRRPGEAVVGLGIKRERPASTKKGPSGDQGCPRISVPGKRRVHPMEESFGVVVVFLEAFGDINLACGVIWLHQE